jgi:hypothetical protein
MRSAMHDIAEAADCRAIPVAAVFHASDHEPPAPAQMLARLGLLLVVAVCFGLIAQILVGVPL